MGRGRGMSIGNRLQFNYPHFESCQDCRYESSTLFSLLPFPFFSIKFGWCLLLLWNDGVYAGYCWKSNVEAFCSLFLLFGLMSQESVAPFFLTGRRVEQFRVEIPIITSSWILLYIQCVDISQGVASGCCNRVRCGK